MSCDARRRAALESLSDVVTEELNVKELAFVASATDLVSFQVKANYRTLGPRFGKAMPEAGAAVAALEGADVARRLAAGEPVEIEVAGAPEALGADDLLVETRQREGFAVEQEADLVVGLLTTLTPELQREGLARELVHHVQNTRKAAGFRIEDRISLVIEGPDEVVAMLAEFAEWVKRETLSVDVVASPPADAEAAPVAVRLGAHTEEVSVNGLAVRMTVTRAEAASE